MSIVRNRRAQIALVVGVLAVGGGVFVGTRIAQADGVPQTQPLTYAGTLLDASGNPATGMVNLDLNLHTTAMGGSAVCSTSGTFNLTTTKGRFQMVLDAACTTAVHATPDLYVDLKVGGASIFTTRPKLGAVPYALEADTSRVARRGLYENPTTMNESSVGGGYCGVTAQTYTGSTVGGYGGAKSKCQAVSGCTSTAHVCSSEEMVRYAATGGTHGAAMTWIASGAVAQIANLTVDDCSGFTSGASSAQGTAWVWTASATSGFPNNSLCNAALAIACCD